MALQLALDGIWVGKSCFNNAERLYYEMLSKATAANGHSTLVSEIAKAREHIKNSLEKMDGIASFASSPATTELSDRLKDAEKKNTDLHELIINLKNICLDSQKRITALEYRLNVQSAPSVNCCSKYEPDNEGLDLFASDPGENDEINDIREKRIAAYAAKKLNKPILIAKSSLVLDVKPWDDETDLEAMEFQLRKITCGGLLWGASKFVPVAFGIQKLTISCVVEDEKVSIDWLTEEIEKLEDYVQSVDIIAFNKV